MKLILGVNDTTYSDPKGIDGQQDPTVGQVAQGIESKYHLMQKFIQLNPQLIGDALAQTIVDLWDGKDVLGTDIGAISQKFKDDLQLKQFDGKIAGVATKASKFDKGWRKNSPRRGPNRPSFVDTGTYKAAMTAVLEE